MYSLSVPRLQYQHILLTSVPGRNFKKRTISTTCTNNGSKIKLSTHRTEGALHLRGDLRVLFLHGERALQLPVKCT